MGLEVPAVVVADGRFAAIPTRFGATFSLFTPLTGFLDEASLSVSVSNSDVTVEASPPNCLSAGDSTGGTIGGSTSAILDNYNLECREEFRQ
jgi:hypothetical protein